MSTNHSTAAPEVSGAIYKGVCPTLGSFGLSHFSSPLRNKALFDSDNETFIAHPERRTFLRPAYANEFDIFKSQVEYELHPTLWVLVEKRGPDLHEITPRWRGKKFWEDYSTDEELADLLQQLSFWSELMSAHCVAMMLNGCKDEAHRMADRFNSNSGTVA